VPLAMAPATERTAANKGLWLGRCSFTLVTSPADASANNREASALRTPSSSAAARSFAATTASAPTWTERLSTPRACGGASRRRATILTKRSWCTLAKQRRPRSGSAKQPTDLSSES